MDSHIQRVPLGRREINPDLRSPNNDWPCRSDSSVKKVPTLPIIEERPSPRPVPGANAFARQASDNFRHRLESNAFLKAEWDARMAIAPNALHPALRNANTVPEAAAHTCHASGNTHDSDPVTTDHAPRDSNVTTIMTFIQAGQSPSPELRLWPSQPAEPTRRAQIEDRKEHESHDDVGTRTPVFGDVEQCPTFEQGPKLQTIDLRKSVGGDSRKVQHTQAGPQAKTQKKGLFGLLKLGASTRERTSAVPVAAPAVHDYGHRDRRPPKAAAILGSPDLDKLKKNRLSFGSHSPSKSNFARSPSKRKFFTRRTADMAELVETQAAAFGTNVESRDAAALQHTCVACVQQGPRGSTAE